MFSLAGCVPFSGGLSASPADPAPGRTVSVVSLNLAKETDPEKVVSAIRSAPRLRDADLFLFQEVVHGERTGHEFGAAKQRRNSQGLRAALSDSGVCASVPRESNASVAEEAARRLGYFVSFEPAAPGVFDQGLALVSRYPLHEFQIKRLKACNLGFRDRKRFSIAATVRTPWSDLRVWNAHLDTRINAEERLQQLEPVIDEASRHVGPRLIGGDFNTNDLFWLRNIAPLPGGPSHGAAIRRAMNRYGFETPLPKNLNTFPMFRRHLDWIFLRELTSVAVSVEPAPFSDHHAIWVRVRL